jgi:hypothetical protein
VVCLHLSALRLLLIYMRRSAEDKYLRAHFRAGFASQRLLRRSTDASHLCNILADCFGLIARFLPRRRVSSVTRNCCTTIGRTITRVRMPGWGEPSTAFRRNIPIGPLYGDFTISRMKGS